MDAQFWIYIVIGAIYFLSRMLKKPEPETPEPTGPKRRPEPAAPSRPVRTEQTERPRQLTFEELLREITEAKQTPRPEPVPEPQYRGYEEVPESEARGLEDVTANEANVYQTYEQTATMERKSLEETLRLADTEVKFGKFEAFREQQRETRAEEYRKLIRNPASLRQAVVMSEILARKF